MSASSVKGVADGSAIRVEVAPGLSLQCYVDDFLWPWEKATPVFMLHGFSRNADFWRRWVPYVAGAHRVYRPELRGFGKSDVPPKNYHFTKESVLGDLVKVMDRLGIEKAHWVGESSGGLFSALLALERPERVASLVLCNTPSTLPQSIKTTYALGEPNVADAQRKFGIGEWCRRTLPYRLDVERASPELQTWVCDEMGKTPAHVGAAFHELIETVDLGPALPKVGCPILIVTGDKADRSDQLSAFEKEVPNARVKLFPGYGHSVNLLAPEECARAAMNFWDELAKTGRKA